MVYFQNFVVCAKVNGKILRDKDGVVQIPFGQEYTILLKNLESRLATVKISVDSEDVLDNNELVVQPNSTLELEGFMKKDRAVNKFKFIEKTQKIEEFRGNKADDGLIRVEYKFQKQKPIVQETVHVDTWERHYGPYWYWYPYTTNTDGITWNYTLSSIPNISKGSRNSPVMKNLNLSSDVPMASCFSIQNLDGITAKGSEIKQQFHSINVGEMEDQSYVMVLKLTGYKKDNSLIEKPVLVKEKVVCEMCGTVNKTSDKYCYECGTHL